MCLCQTERKGIRRRVPILLHTEGVCLPDHAQPGHDRREGHVPLPKNLHPLQEKVPDGQHQTTKLRKCSGKQQSAVLFFIRMFSRDSDSEIYNSENDCCGILYSLMQSY